MGKHQPQTRPNFYSCQVKCVSKSNSVPASFVFFLINWCIPRRLLYLRVEPVVQQDLFILYLTNGYKDQPFNLMALHHKLCGLLPSSIMVHDIRHIRCQPCILTCTQGKSALTLTCSNNMYYIKKMAPVTKTGGQLSHER